MRSKAVLCRYVTDDRLEVDADPEKEKNRKLVLQSIQDHVFWNNLDDLRQVLGLLHEEQVKSESGKAHIGYVIVRWHKIEHHLRSLQHHATFTPGQKLDALFSDRTNRAGNLCSSIWGIRFNKQVMDIHWAAYHLDPDHQPIAMTPTTQANVLRYMLKTITGDAEKRELRINFFAFKQQDQPFDITNEIWAEKKEPLLFWQMAFTIAPK